MSAQCPYQLCQLLYSSTKPHSLALCRFWIICCSRELISRPHRARLRLSSPFVEPPRFFFLPRRTNTTTDNAIGPVCNPLSTSRHLATLLRILPTRILIPRDNRDIASRSTQARFDDLDKRGSLSDERGFRAGIRKAHGNSAPSKYRTEST